jgi:hypothetical protein
MKLILSLLLVLIPAITIAAEKVMKVPESGFEQCDISEEIKNRRHDSLAKEKAILDQTFPIWDQLQEVASKATIKDKPLKDQLPSGEIIKFAELSQRLKSANLSHLIENKRQRDLNVIEKMILIADMEYRWQKTPDESSDDFFIYAIIRALRSSIEISDLPPPMNSTCTLEYAIHSVSKEAIKRWNAGGKRLDSAMNELEAINAKYGTNPVDHSRFSKTDLKKVNELMSVVTSMWRHIDFIKDIENIKLMVQASDIIYESNKHDIAASGGVIEAVGKDYQRRKEAGEFSEKIQIAVGVWSKINEKIPCDLVIQWDELYKSRN